MLERFDVVIVGGGFTGVALAAALADGRRRIAVLEARAGRNVQFRGELIHPPGVRDLDALGLLAPLRRAGGTEVSGFAVIPDVDAPAVTLPYDPTPGSAAVRGFAMEHPEMVEALRAEASRRPGVEVRLGERVTEVIREDARVAGVRTASGRTYRAGLTLIAEGRNSQLRAMLGLDGETRLLSYSTTALARDAALPVPGHGHVVIGPPGPLLAYPIGDAVRFCIDVPTDTPKGRAAFEARLRGEYIPKVPRLLGEALARALDEGTLEICATHQVRTTRCVAPGAALVGDAGGCSHPLTATGMTSCLNDVRTLAAALDEEHGVDLALRRFERARYRYARAREVLTERLYEVFLGRDPGNLALRDGMLDYWQDTARARVASMALLSGQRHDALGFAKEFATVFSYAARAAVRRSDRAGATTLGDRAAVLRAVSVAAAETLARSSVTVAREMLR